MSTDLKPLLEKALQIELKEEHYHITRKEEQELIKLASSSFYGYKHLQDCLLYFQDINWVKDMVELGSALYACWGQLPDLIHLHQKIKKLVTSDRKVNLKCLGKNIEG